MGLLDSPAGATTGKKAALQGSSGAPGPTNRYVTEADRAGRPPAPHLYRPGLWYGPLGPRGAVAVANGRLMLAPMFLPQAVPFDQFGANVTIAGAASTVLRCGIYADLAGVPGAIIDEWGTLAADAVAVPTAAIAKTYGPGVYWVGGAAQGGTPTCQTISADGHVGSNNAGANNAGFFKDGFTTGALPTASPYSAGTQLAITSGLLLVSLRAA